MKILPTIYPEFLVNFSQNNKFVAIGRWIASTIENLFDVESSLEAIG